MAKLAIDRRLYWPRRAVGSQDVPLGEWQRRSPGVTGGHLPCVVYRLAADLFPLQPSARTVATLFS